MHVVVPFVSDTLRSMAGEMHVRTLELIRFIETQDAHSPASHGARPVHLIITMTRVKIREFIDYNTSMITD